MEPELSTRFLSTVGSFRVICIELAKHCRDRIVSTRMMCKIGDLLLDTHGISASLRENILTLFEIRVCGINEKGGEVQLDQVATIFHRTIDEYIKE